LIGANDHGFLGGRYRWYCCWYVSANFQNGRCCI
ncbi:uncharacterized protein METZ01_LOCUS178049, partial [marine metagenome]